MIISCSRAVMASIGIASAFLALALCLIQGVSASITPLNRVVNTTSGPVKGEFVKLKTNKTLVRFLGVPFAQAARFEVPTPVKPWTETVNATAYGKSCPQNVNIEVKSYSDMSEDCLFLNVFVPSTSGTANRSLPVMVWIYGGGYTVGTASTKDYDGSILATEGEVIVVSMNYRLGVLGFLSTGSDISGNFGLLDQTEAFRWVKKNIGCFGGDAQNVTIFGQSAGGGSVAMHMLSPRSQGLFHKAILESGTAVAPWSFVEMEKAKSDARSLAKQINCEDVKSLKSCLEKMDFTDIVKAQAKLGKSLSLGPVVDHNFLPDSPMKLLSDGNFSKTPVMIGVTKNEGAFWLFPVPGFHPGILSNFSDRGIDMDSFKALVNNGMWTKGQNEEILDYILYEYTDWANLGDRQTTLQQFVDLISDSSFKAPAVLSAKKFIRQNLDTYFYCFDHWRESRFFPNWTGAYHTAELPFVFGRALSNYSRSNENDTEVVFTKKVIQWWTNFAKMGNPTPKGEDLLARDEFVWPRYSADKQQYAFLTPTPAVEAKMRREKMAFWNTFVPNLKTTPQPSPPLPTSTVSPTKSPGETEAQSQQKTVNALIAVVVLLCIAVLILAFVVIRVRRKLAVAAGDPGPNTRLI